MVISPETRDRPTVGVTRLVGTRGHLGGRAAGQLYGELPPAGWALLQRHEDGARQLAGLLDRLVSDLETTGMYRHPVARHGIDDTTRAASPVAAR